ncbi:helix-turn-helix domain-containing protein [Actinomadura sp. 6N118]|uniref:AraC-like ligand-binding domain-containing protein n=1 Tax=Actinomadura sp. 6N118 TaxID=3375151 RepID=UPI0037BC8A07
MEVSTDGVPAGERFGYWHEVSARTWVPYELRCPPPLKKNFKARLSFRELGSVQVTLMTTTPYEIHRTDKLIRQSDPGMWKLGVAVRGAGTATQDDRHTEFAVGDLVLYDTSRPYSAALATDIGTGQLLVLQFARSQLPLPHQALRRLTAARIPGSHGIGALTSQFLLQLARHIDEYSAADAGRLSTLALDVLAAAIAHELDTASSVPAQTQHRVLLARIDAFVEQNLGDPRLTPSSIAAAHNISLRYLHKLFHEQDRTVAGWIRERRLERCRHDLADPLLATRPIGAVAARWGFTNPAHFSQSFRSAYNLSPRQFRELHASSLAPSGPEGTASLTSAARSAAPAE